MPLGAVAQDQRTDADNLCAAADGEADLLELEGLIGELRHGAGSVPMMSSGLQRQPGTP
jgi:hypothetical protein